MSQPLTITTLAEARDALQDYLKDYGVEPDSDAAEEMVPDMVSAVCGSIEDRGLIEEFCLIELGWVTSEAQRRINELSVKNFRASLPQTANVQVYDAEGITTRYR